MTPKEFAEVMQKLMRGSDEEVEHQEADKLICKILTELGYGEGVAVFIAATKWYA